MPRRNPAGLHAHPIGEAIQARLTLLISLHFESLLLGVFALTAVFGIYGLPGEKEVNRANPASEFRFDVWPCPPPGFSGSWARPRQHNSNRLMLVLSAGWSFRDSVAAPCERLLDAARAELFSVSPERACGLSPSRCRYGILMGDPFTRLETNRWIRA